MHIRINDDGVDVENNIEFDGRFDKENSCTEYSPDPSDLDGHGTKVAGIAVGNADNDHCAVGIAPMATFSACNVRKGGSVDATTFAEKMEVVDVSSNSIGIEYVLRNSGETTEQGVVDSSLVLTNSAHILL